MLDVTLWVDRMNQYWAIYLDTCATGTCNPIYSTLTNMLYGMLTYFCGITTCVYNG